MGLKLVKEYQNNEEKGEVGSCLPADRRNKGCNFVNFMSVER